MYASVWPPESIGAGQEEMQRSPEGLTHQAQVMESASYSHAGVTGVVRPEPGRTERA